MSARGAPVIHRGHLSLRSTAGALLLLLSSCGDDRLKLIAPDLPASASLVAILFESESGEVVGSTGLFPPGDGRWMTVERAIGAARVRAVGYRREDLADLAPPDAETLAAARLTVANERSTGWLPAPLWAGGGALEPPVVTLAPEADGRFYTASWVPACTRDPCELNPLAPATRILITGERTGLMLAVPWDRSRRAAFVSSAGGRSYRVDPLSGTVVRLSDAALPAGLQAGRLLPDDRLLIVDTDGRLLLGRPETGLEIVAWPNGGMAPRRISANERGGPEAFVTNIHGAILHWSEEAGTSTVIDLARETLGAVAWQGPDRAIAGFEDPPELLFYEHGRLDEQEAEELTVTAIAIVPGLGPVIATRAVTPPVVLWRLEDRTPIALGGVPPDITYAADDIWPLGREGELLLGGTRGELLYYRRGSGGCLLPRAFRANITSAVALEGGVLVTTHAVQPDQDQAAMFLPFRDRAQIPHACPFTP